ncbi:hypothetical protein EGM51_16455 [Verrucomicrobia bacterium S94]|nr:hypothetical protein EGM51_16455 [Verrucomicrobia bacterium S94]
MPADIHKDELLEAIQNDGPREVVKQYRHNLLPSRVLIDLYSEHPERDVLLFLALYPTVPSQVLEDLADACADPEIQAAIATNPRCSHLLLVRMAREGGPAVRAALAANKLQNSKITSELLNDPSLTVRASLAGNSTINDNYRAALACDPEPAVRASLAFSAKLPAEIAHALSADNSAVVRAAILGFGRVDDELLQGWAASDDLEMQRLLLGRSKLKPELIDTLRFSPDPLVKNAVKDLYEPDAAELLARAESDSEPLRAETAGYSALPVEIQHILAADSSAGVRAALAANPKIDEEVALLIATSNDPAACRALAGNPNLPESVKIELCHHESDDVRLQMIYRNDLDEEMVNIFVNDREDMEAIAHLALKGVTFTRTKPELLEKLLAHKRPSLRAFACAAEELTNSHVRKLTRDDAVCVRLALCENPILTRFALTELSKDWNPAVAERAREKLEQLPETDNDTEFNEPDGEETLVSKIVNFFK